jgi:uncharacterized protein (UPF0303 family)
MNDEVGFRDSDHGFRLRHNCAHGDYNWWIFQRRIGVRGHNTSIDMGFARGLAIAVEVRLKEWIVFHASLPGSTADNDSWIARKARVVLATGNSTMYERVLAEEQGIDWYAVKGLPEETHAIHGGGLPLNVKGLGCVGVLLISGLPQVQDHLLGVEVLTEFLARKGELQ